MKEWPCQLPCEICGSFVQSHQMFQWCLKNFSSNCCVMFLIRGLKSWALRQEINYLLLYHHRNQHNLWIPSTHFHNAISTSLQATQIVENSRYLMLESTASFCGILKKHDRNFHPRVWCYKLIEEGWKKRSNISFEWHRSCDDLDI